MLYTGGDNPGVISGTFATAIRYRAEVVITALKVSAAGSEKSPAQIAYEFIEQRSSFESTCIDICGRRLRSVEEESKCAQQIVEIVQSYVSPKKDK